MRVTLSLLCLLCIQSSRSQVLLDDDIIPAKADQIMEKVQNIEKAQRAFENQLVQQLKELQDHVTKQSLSSTDCCHQTQNACMKIDLLLPGIKGTGKKCPKDYVDFGMSCYRMFTQAADWWKASQTCQDEGAHLVAIESREEDRFLQGIRKAHGVEKFWTGGNDQGTEGHFKWVMKGTSFGYTNWEHAQPDNWKTFEHCMGVDEKGWNDMSCRVGFPFICEKNTLA